LASRHRPLCSRVASSDQGENEESWAIEKNVVAGVLHVTAYSHRKQLRITKLATSSSPISLAGGCGVAAYGSEHGHTRAYGTVNLMAPYSPGFASIWPGCSRSKNSTD
jgi:hypothetical protein